MKKTALITLMMLAALLSSCVHRGFDYDNGRIGYVEVVFDWRNAPAADPQSMALYLYPEDGGDPLRYEFKGRDGGLIRVPVGKYDAICINTDKRDVLYEGEKKFPTFEVTTPELSSVTFGSGISFTSSALPGTPDTEGQVTMMQPPMLWSSSERGIDIIVESTPKSKKGIEIEVEHQVITMYPKPIVDTYIVTVLNVRNPQHLRSLRGTINNMSDGYLGGPMIRTDTSVLLSFNLAHDIGAANAEGMFLTFGHCPDARRPHTLILYAILTDGSKYYYTFDVSDQAHNPPDENGIYHIIVEFIDIPEPTGPPDFSMDVDDWESVDIFIKM